MSLWCNLSIICHKKNHFVVVSYRNWFECFVIAVTGQTEAVSDAALIATEVIVDTVLDTVLDTGSHNCDVDCGGSDCDCGCFD